MQQQSKSKPSTWVHPDIARFQKGFIWFFVFYFLAQLGYMLLNQYSPIEFAHKDFRNMFLMFSLIFTPVMLMLSLIITIKKDNSTLMHAFVVVATFVLIVVGTMVNAAGLMHATDCEWNADKYLYVNVLNRQKLVYKENKKCSDHVLIDERLVEYSATFICWRYAKEYQQAALENSGDWIKVDNPAY